MRRLLVSLVAAVAVILPASAAGASDSRPVGINMCPSGYKGVVVWHYDQHSGYTYVWACVPN
ncbi:MAG: hypothetical protein M3134_09275 [Actinomycetota bacterium]|nr:hypothetical protein [Actinomycetota bacterium]